MSWVIACKFDAIMYSWNVIVSLFHIYKRRNVCKESFRQWKCQLNWNPSNEAHYNFFSNRLDEGWLHGKYTDTLSLHLQFSFHPPQSPTLLSPFSSPRDRYVKEKRVIILVEEKASACTRNYRFFPRWCVRESDTMIKIKWYNKADCYLIT